MSPTARRPATGRARYYFSSVQAPFFPVGPVFQSFLGPPSSTCPKARNLHQEGRHTLLLPLMLAAVAAPSIFPDDPRKWNGWAKYNAESPYERLCLDPRKQPGDEEIQAQCTALLQWWQNKLPLKNQPSNPIAQLLGRGIDEAPRSVVQARMELLDPVRRRAWDEKLAAQTEQDALDEFIKFIGFSIKDGVLPADAEANLVEFGRNNDLPDEQIKTCIEEELKRRGARRSRLVATAPAPAPEPATASRM